MSLLNERDAVHSAFTQYPAYAELETLAKNPIDLTIDGNLNQERISKFVSENAGYKLLYATERVDGRTIKALEQLAKEAKAIEKMNRMQNGEIMNRIENYPSENREVLHTAVRDFFENPNGSQKAKEATEKAAKEIQKLKEFIHKIDCECDFQDMIFVAIGGSELGPKALYLALEYLKKPCRNVYFLSNVDPDNAAQVLKQVKLKNTLVLVISKSGTTLETKTNEEFIRKELRRAGLDPTKHVAAITGECSPLDDKMEYMETFYIWDWIGGRYSSTSMVGGVMLSFAFGFDLFWELLKGANAMDKAALLPDIKQNLPLLGALLGIWNRNFLNYETVAFIPYSAALGRFCAHLQQVDMESNGKRIDKQGHAVNFQTGPILWGEPGTNSQHSFHQLLHQGTSIVDIEFVGFKENQWEEDLIYQDTSSQEKLVSNLFAQAIALATGQKNENPNKQFPGNRPSHILLAKKLTPFTLGALLSYYENKVAFQGFIWNINSFDQEGVQLGKVLANRIINIFAARRTGGQTEPYPIAEAFLKHYDDI